VSAPAAGWRLGVGTVRWPGPGCWRSSSDQSVSDFHESDRDLFAWVDLGRPQRVPFVFRDRPSTACGAWYRNDLAGFPP